MTKEVPNQAASRGGMTTSREGLVIDHLSKTFAGQRALNNVSISVPRHAVTALLGQNGSGKSTLIKILAGFYEPDQTHAEVHLDGRVLPLPIDPQLVHQQGLRFVHQDLGLVNDLTIADNFAFADRFRTVGILGPIRQKAEYQRVAESLDSLGIHESPGKSVGSLDPTTRTMIALARAIQGYEVGGKESRPPVLVLDEPTAALPSGEVHRLLGLVDRIRDLGGAVLYVSHRLDEVLAISDRLVILRDGEMVVERDRAGLNTEDVIQTMLGSDSPLPARPQRNESSRRHVLLQARAVGGVRLRGIDFDVHEGEIVGVGGLIGCGRSELIRAIAGVQRMGGGTCELEGIPYAPANPQAAIARGVSHVPQDRRGQGCIPMMSMQANLTLGTLGEFSSHGWLSLRAERKAVQEITRRFDIRPPDPGRLMAHFSGGNQQKGVIAKAIRHQLTLLLLDEPLQGVDIGAKHEIGEIIRGLAKEGVAIVIGASDNDDLVELADRVVVLDRGVVVGELSGQSLTVENLTLLCAGEKRS